MGISLQSVIKVGMLRKKEDGMNRYTDFLYQHPEVVITVNAYEVGHFLAQVKRPSDLDVILVCEHPLDGTDQSPLIDLHQKFPHASIIYFSAKQNIEHILWVIQAGAGGYIPSGVPPKFFIREFDNFIKCGGLLIPPLCLLQILLHYFPPGNEDYSMYHLTRTETEIITNINQGRSPAEIASYQKKDIHLVNKHLKNIFNKIDLKNSVSIASDLPSLVL